MAARHHVVDSAAAMELEHAIGYAALPAGLHYHPNGADYVCAAGGTVVISSLTDPHAQVRAASPPLSSHVTRAINSHCAVSTLHMSHSKRRSALRARHATLRCAQSILVGHDANVSCLALGSTGALIASGQSGGDSPDVIVWSFASRTELYRLSEHEHGIQVRCVAHWASAQAAAAAD
jgi:cilia- and flagella-associated protein 52